MITLAEAIAQFEETHDGDPAVRVLMRQLIEQDRMNADQLELLRHMRGAIETLTQAFDLLSRRVDALEKR